MANWQVISLDTTTPQLRAPGTGDGYSFNSGSTQLGVWTTTGLGIGTASPGAKLEVNTSGNGDGLWLRNSTTNMARLYRGTSGTNPGVLDLYASDVIRVKIDGEVGAVSYFNAGNVGIGTASPANRLDVIQTAGGFTGIRTNSQSAAQNSDSGLRLVANCATVHTNWLLAAQYNAAGFEITPSTAAGGGTFSTPAFFVSTTGNVGIGTTSPSNTAGFSRQVQIEGTTAALTLSGTTGTGKYTLGVPGVNAIGLWDNTASAYRWYVDSSGNVGIGTSSPGAKLQVSGTTKVGTGAASNSATFMVNNLNATATGIQLFQDGQESWIMGLPASSTALTWANSGSEKMRLDTSGNLGIGTSSPSAKLDVQGGSINTSSFVTIIPITATNNALYRATNTGGTFYAGIDNSAGGVTGTAYSGILWHTGAYPISFGTNSAERMRLDASGNLGLNVTPSAWAGKAFQIGNASNSGWASIGYDANGKGFFATTAYNNSGSSWTYTATGFAATLYSADSGAHKWFTAPSGTAGNAITFTQAMTLDASGNLLVGTTTASYDTGKVGSTHKFLNVQAGASLYAVNTLAGNQSAAGNRLGLLAFVNDTNSATYKYSAWVLSETEGSTANQLGARIVLSTTGDASAAGPIERARVDAKGNVVVNTAAVATTATDGFLYIPTCAGAPTGVPTTFTGRSPLVVDSTNNRFYVYVNGAWKYATLT